MQDQHIRHQVVVLHHFLLLMPEVGGNDARATKEAPFCKPVKLLVLVGCGVNGLAQLHVVDVIEQEAGAHDLSQLPEGEIQLVLATVGSQPSQNG